jgi:hypothetical protein
MLERIIAGTVDRFKTYELGNGQEYRLKELILTLKSVIRPLILRQAGPNMQSVNIHPACMDMYLLPWCVSLSRYTAAKRNPPNDHLPPPPRAARQVRRRRDDRLMPTMPVTLTFHCTPDHARMMLSIYAIFEPGRISC